MGKPQTISTINERGLVVDTTAVAERYSTVSDDAGSRDCRMNSDKEPFLKV